MKNIHDYGELTAALKNVETAEQACQRADPTDMVYAVAAVRDADAKLGTLLVKLMKEHKIGITIV